MTESLLFATGSVVFILVSTAILWYGYLRFNEVYERDQSGAAGQLEDNSAAIDAAAHSDLDG